MSRTISNHITEEGARRPRVSGINPVSQAESAGPYPVPNIQISTDGGYQPVWSKNSNELFYLEHSGVTVTVMAVTFETEPEFKVVSSQKLFEGRYETYLFHNYDVARNGRFLMIQNPRESTPVGINIVLNWFEELKQLVPPQEAP